MLDLEFPIRYRMLMVWTISHVNSKVPHKLTNKKQQQNICLFVLKAKCWKWREVNEGHFRVQTQNNIRSSKWKLDNQIQ